MDQGNHLFNLALGLVPPWMVDDVRFTVEEKRLDLHMNFPRGSQFPCPVCGQDCPVYDTQEKVWRHLDFFQHAAYLHARVPRVQCPEHGVHLVFAPWAREGSGFTLFEALVMAMVREMPVLTVSRLVRETDQRLWRVLDHYVAKAREAVDMSEVHSVGVDETSSRRGHDYITLFVDLVAKRLLFATPGKDAETFAQFAEVLQAHGGSAEAITEVSMDLSPAFQKGAAEHLPNAQVTFDRFHLMKLVNEAVDAVRKGEALSQPDLKKSRWLWLKNPGNLSAKQSARLQEILKNQNLKTAHAKDLGWLHAYKRFHLTFQESYTIQDRHLATVLLRAWISTAMMASGLSPLVKVAYTLMNHWNGLLRWFVSQITNGIIEGFNNALQSARAKTRGYRTHKNFIHTAYLIPSKLELGLPRRNVVNQPVFRRVNLI